MYVYGIWPFEATFFAHAYKKGAVIGIFQIVSQGACIYDIL